jgi:hypothetical protein
LVEALFIVTPVAVTLPVVTLPVVTLLAVSPPAVMALGRTLRQSRVMREPPRRPWGRYPQPKSDDPRQGHNVRSLFLSGMMGRRKNFASPKNFASHQNRFAHREDITPP